MSTLRRRKLRQLIESQVIEMANQRQKLSREDLITIINEEYENLANEGFWKGAAAAASRFLPGGGAVLDYARSQGFERLEKRLDVIEARLNALESGSGSI
tara:strand:- start:3 stop:302 length:300 start_codon:yes stop_codon:yes gene_type:complete